LDQAAIDAFDETTQGELFAELGVVPSTIEDLGGFESFVFARKDRDSILRVTHQGHRSLDEIMGEMHWVNHLARNEASVCSPVPQRSGDLAVEWGDFVISEFERAEGRIIQESDWDTPLFERWGESIGRFHRLAQGYQPGEAAWRRMHWREDPNFDVAARVSPAEVKVIERGNQHNGRMAALRDDDDVFGIVHCDAHAGNFHWDGDNITFFDFDDTCYCWFGYDVATVLFSAVLQEWIENSRAAQEATGREFLSAFLEGYSKEADTAGLLLEAFPIFLKVRELSLYAVIRAHLGDDYEDHWYTSKFMRDRLARIENDEPYLDISF
jgi:Ser/Thr protein kinase RdoA (MazF antagonist)